MKASPKIMFGLLFCLCVLQYSCKGTQKAKTNVPVYENPYRTDESTNVSKSPSAIYEPVTPHLPSLADATPESQENNNSTLDYSEQASSTVVTNQEETTTFPPYSAIQGRKTNSTVIDNTLVETTVAVTNLLPENIDAVLNKYKRAEIYFKVQVAAFRKKQTVNDTYFQQMPTPDIQIDVAPSGIYRYTVGFFKTYEAAMAHEEELKTLGYTDAFVAAYDNNNNRINKEMTKVLMEYEHGY